MISGNQRSIFYIIWSLYVMRQIRLVTETFLDQPASNTAISAALLSLTAESKQPETLRLFVPSPVLAFGPQDLRCENFSKAVDYSFKICCHMYII